MLFSCLSLHFDACFRLERKKRKKRRKKGRAVVVVDIVVVVVAVVVVAVAVDAVGTAAVGAGRPDWNREAADERTSCKAAVERKRRG